MEKLEASARRHKEMRAEAEAAAGAAARARRLEKDLGAAQAKLNERSAALERVRADLNSPPLSLNPPPLSLNPPLTGGKARVMRLDHAPQVPNASQALWIGKPCR